MMVVPMMTESTASGETAACWTAAREAAVASSVAESPFSLPPKAPKAVRFAPTMYKPGIAFGSVSA